MTAANTVGGSTSLAEAAACVASNRAATVGLDHHQQATSNSTLQTLKRLSSLHFYAKPWTMSSYINANNDNNTLAPTAVGHNDGNDNDLHDTQEGESW